ncbi:M23 family metallopeptidase [Halobacterium sp. CBA1126]|uniref:M23 family metallopeptidase n=1 Tax=Halobacterium sp. CBA1126 TaxID=2668074 RepID=UPI0012FBAC14|nr:peptidoglycan DD-metalloendopeptidase family protein [Halobacterium sp. CBA1126]
MTDSPADTADESFRAQVRERLTAINPVSLSLLGFVGVVGNLVPELEILQLFHVFWLFLLWPLASLLVHSLKQALGYETAAPDPRDWLAMDDGWRSLFAFLLGVPLSVLNPLLGRQDVMQLLGSLTAVLRHRGSLPAPDTHTQSTTYRLPVAGTWTVVNGSPIKAYSHSWFPATQRYAYDFVITDDDGRTRPQGTDTSVENYYCYGEPVVAPADGRVVDVHDGDPELGRAGGFSHPLKRSVTGNAVTIRHAPEEYSTLVHLIPGSIDVGPGDYVTRGEQLARCGHSGNSSEPHLHFQVQDHPTFELAAGFPVRFDDTTVDTPGVDVTETADWHEPTTGPGRYVHVGQRVTHTPSNEPPQTGDQPPDADATTLPGLGMVRMLAQTVNGFAIGGFVTVLAGLVVPRLATVAVVLGGLTVLGVAYHGWRRLVENQTARLTSVALTGGLSGAAALVGAFSTINALPSLGPFALGAGVFVAAFLAYTAVWEYARRAVLSDTGLSKSDAN